MGQGKKKGREEMKSKKLISLLCAAALSASSFAGLAVTASAAATPVWSFDGSDTTGWSGSVAPTVKTDEGSTDNYLNFEAPVGKATNDTTFTLPTEAQLSDDYVLEYDTYIHGGNGMGRLNHYTQLAFTGANPVQDTQTYGGEYATAAQAINPDTAHSWSQDLNAGMGYTTDIVSSLTSRIELSCQGRWVINQKNVEPNFATDGTTVGDDKWVRVRAAVKDGKAAITIADSNQKYVDAQEFDADATKLSKIMLTFARADQVNFVPTTATTIKLDNIKVYDGIANAPAFSTDGLRATAVVATPIPAPEKVAGAAPKQYAPEAAITPYIANFNSAETGTITYVLKQEGGQDAKTVVNGMKVQVGTRKESEDTMTYASIVEPAAGDKALRLNAGDMSTNGRGPVVSFDDDLSIEDMTGTSTILGFSTYISRTHLDGISRLFLLDNTDNVDGNSVARDVLAVITTEDIQNEDESYKYTAGEKNIGIHVEPDQWHKIAVAISENEYRVFVDGQYKDADGRLSPALKNDLVGTGEGNKNAVTHLPMFAIENTKTSKLNEETGLYEGGSAHATALIDNVVAYQIQGEVNDKLLPLSEGTDPTPAPATPTPVPKHSATIAWDNTAKKATVTAAANEEAAFDGVLIHAAYDSLGIVKSVKTYNVTNITDDGIEVPFASDDTVYTGDKLLLWNNLKDMVPYGSLTVTAGETPVQKYTITNATAADANGTVVLSATTAEAGAEITVTVTPADGYEIDTFTVKDADNADVTVTNGKFTMPAKNVTVTATFKAIPVTYTVSGTVDANVDTVKLTGTDNNGVYTGVIADTAVTFSNVPAGTYTIEATAKAGYEIDTIKVADAAATTVTVSDADVTTLAITTKVSALPAITGTVAIEGTAKVGQTLTATVTGLNDGKTAKYQWQANTGAEDAYVAIENATASTFEIPESLLGKTIKVVVTADGTSGSIESAATAAVAAKTYTVSGTVDAGVDTVKLHISTAADDHTGDITGTIDGTTVTFENVVAGTYDIEATAKTGYKDVVIKVGETATTTVEVTNANVENLAITTTKKIAVTGTVAGTGVTAVKLTEKLEAGSDATPAEYTGTIKDGTVTFDDIKAATYTVSATGTDSYISIVINNTEITVTAAGLADAFTVTGTDTALYRENVTALTSAQISYSLVEADIANTAAVTAEEVAKSNVADFGTATEKTAAIPTLDGWGYRHFANASMDKSGTFQPGRQTKAGVDAAANAVYASGVGNGGCNGAVSFILGNVSNVTVPSTGKIVYTFDAIVKTTAGTAVKNHTFGLTSAADGSSVSSVASTTIANSTTETVTKKIVMTYSVDNKTYTISVDGVQVANGKTDTPVTGIYAQAGEAYADVSIANLVVTTTESDPAITVNTVNAAEGESATADKFEAQAGDTITITVKKNAGRKVSVTAKDDNEAPIAVTESDGKYTFTMPAEGNATVTVTYARADVTAIEISGDAQVSVSARTANYTAVAKADTTPVNGTITWSIAPAETGGATITGTTAINSSSGVLTLDPNQGAGKIVITASTKKDITSDSTEAANTVTATKEVTLVTEPVYSVTKGTETNGTFTISAETAKTADTITVVPSPATGYAIGEVSYTPENGEKVVVTDNEGYKIKGITANITVNVTFTAIPYAITNATVAANGNSAAIKIGDADAGTATVGQTVTIVPTVAQGYKVASAVVTKTGDADTKVTVTNNTFKMPAYAVTVTVTFETWDGIFYENTFTLEDTDTADFLKKANCGDITRKISSGAFVFSTTKGNGTRSDYQDLGADISGASEYKVTYDWTLGTSGTVGETADADGTVSWISFADSSYKVVFALEVFNGRMYLYKGGNQKAGAGKNDDNVIWSAGVGTAVKLMESGATNGLAVKVEATVNYGTGKMDITVKKAEDGSVLGTLTNVDIVDAKNNIRYIAMGSGRNGSGTISSNITNAKIDNILITAPWYTAPAAGGTE